MADVGIKITAQDNTKTAFDSVGRNLGNIQTAAASVAGSLAALGVGISVSGFVAMTKQIVDGLDAMNDLKDATGSTIENISALEDVALRTGSSFETVSTALTKLNKALSSAKPDSDTERAIKAIGLSVKDLKELDPAEAFQKIAVGLSGFADDANKARLVQELFGKSLKEVAPLLKDLAESGKLNSTVTTAQAEAAEKLNKQIFNLQKNALDAKRALVSELLPALVDGADRFLLAYKHAGSLIGVLALYARLDYSKNVQGNLGEVEKQIAGLEERATRITSASAMRGNDKMITDLKAQASYLKELRQTRILAEQSDNSDAVSRKFMRPLRTVGDVTGEGNAPKAPRETGNAFAAEQDAAKEWAKAYEAAGKSRDELIAKNLGLSKSEEELKKYMESVAASINDKTNPAMRDMIEAAYQANIELERLGKVADLIETQSKRTSAAEDETQKERERVAAIGLTTEAVAELNATRLEEMAVAREYALLTAKEIDLSGELAKSIQGEVKALRERAGLARSGAQKEAAVEAAKAAADEWKRGWEQTDNLAREAFTDWVEDGSSAAKKIGDTLKKALLAAIYDATLKPLVMQVYTSVAGGQPGLGGALGATGGTSNLLSTGSSLYNSYGKTALGAVGGWLGLGGASAGASSTAVGSSFAGAASNGAFAAANGGAAASSAGFAGIPVVGWIMMGMLASGEAYDKGFKYGNKGGEGYTVSDGGLIGPNGMVGGIDRILQGIGIDPKTAAILSGSALGSQAMYSVLGGYNVSNVGGGLSGTLTASGSSLQKRTDYTQDHRGFLGIGSYTTHNSEYSAADAGVTAYVDKGLKTVVSSVKTFAGMLGLSVDKIDGYSKAIDISLDGLKPEEQQAAIDKALTGFSDGLVSSSFGTSITSLSKEGETASQTMMRLGVDLQAIKDGFATLGVDVSKLSLTTIDGLHGVIDELVVVDSVFNTLGYTLFDVSAAGGAAAQGLAQAFGGLQSFQAQTASLFQNYYTPAEQRQQTYQSVADGLKAAGITGFSVSDIAGATREQIRTVVDQYAGKIGTTEGDRQYAAIVAGANTLNPYVAGFADPNKKPEAPRQEFGSSGGGGGAPVQDAALSAWQDATDAIIKTMSDLRTTLVDSGPDSYAKLQAQFAIEAASAKAGNLSAAQDLPALAKALVDAGKSYNTSSVQQALLTARVLDTLGSVAGVGSAGANLSIPKFAAGGYHAGGWALVGEQGPELVNMPSARVYTAQDTRAMLGGGTDPAVLEELRALRAELAAIRAATGVTAVNTGKSAKVLDAATKGGQPLATTAV